MIVKDAELELVVGRRGTGKSTLTALLLGDRPKVVVFDPRAEYDGRGWTQCRTLKAVLDAMKKRWAKGFKIAFVPVAGQEPEQLHKLTRVLWRAQAPYEAGRDPRKLTLVVEEADLSYPVHRLPAELNGMNAVCNQGRHVGIEAIAVTQRPALINANFRGNAARVYVLPLADENDKQAILKQIGRAHDSTLRTLEPYHFLMLENGQVRPGRLAKKGRKVEISLAS